MRAGSPASKPRQLKSFAFFPLRLCPNRLAPAAAREGRSNLPAAGRAFLANSVPSRSTSLTTVTLHCFRGSLKKWRLGLP